MENYAHLNEEEIRSLVEDIPNDIVLDNVSELFKIFGDKTRVSILFLLLEKGEMCVCDLSAAMNMNQSAVSHQLRTLKSARLVKYRRQGKEVIYSLSDEHIRTIFDMALEHVGE